MINIQWLFFFIILERREQELRDIPEWRKFWKKIQKKEKGESKPEVVWERHFLQVKFF